MDVVSISGAILSGIGAAIAIWQACKVRRYRDEILRDRLRLLLIEVIGIAHKARQECRKIVTPVAKPVRGVNKQEVINSIRDCLERIRDNSHRFNHSALDRALAESEGQLNGYIQENAESQRFSIADKLYKSLGDVISKITEEIDRVV